MLEKTPLTTLEKLLFRSYMSLLEFGNLKKGWINPAEFRIADENSRREFKTVIRAVEEGLPNSRPLAEERWKTFGEFPTGLEGEENLVSPPFVIAANHYNRGRLQGLWQPPVMVEAITNIIDHSSKTRFRFIINGRKFTNFSNGIMSNFAKVCDGITTFQTREIIETLINGDVLGIFPSAKPDLELNKMDQRAGNLFLLAGKRNIPVIPVGAWFDKQNRVYRVNFGKPVFFGQTDRLFSNQTIADAVGIKIANLLPENFRGYYRGISP